MKRPINPERTWRRVRRRAQKVGVRPLRLHCARHTWASLALAAGKSVRWAADQLGHDDPALTLRVYAHVIPGAETDLSFLSFDGSRRHFCEAAPPSGDDAQNENAPAPTERGRRGITGAPGTTRTCDLQVRNLALYPTELRARGIEGAGL
jgi:hypothetical protein